jgi:hypothetical protein
MTPSPVTPTPVTVAPTFNRNSPTFVVNPATDLEVLYVDSAFGQPQQINPWYCATLDVATRFLAYLKGKLGLSATIVWGYPLGTWPTGPFAQSGMVPYFSFALNSDGSVPGPPDNVAIQNVAGLLVQYQFTAFMADQLMLTYFQTS